MVPHLSACFLQEKRAGNSMARCSALDTEVHKIVCIDEIDETSSSHKWTKKAQKQLEKLNNDSNLTAGLEAELTLAVGARVML